MEPGSSIDETATGEVSSARPGSWSRAEACVDASAKERLRIPHAGWIAREHPAIGAGGNPG